jgi:hypothetical protein
VPIVAPIADSRFEGVPAAGDKHQSGQDAGTPLVTIPQNNLDVPLFEMYSGPSRVPGSMTAPGQRTKPLSR